MDEKAPGFFYGYVIIAAGFFIQTVGWGIGNSFGVFFNPLIQEFSWSRAGISGAASMGFLVHGCASILLGNLNDRFGPRIIMSGCGIFLGLGYILASNMEALWQLYLFYGLIASAGLGGIDVIPLSTVSRWFAKKRGMMSGLIKVGTGAGMFVMPFFINWLLLEFGWRRAFTVLGGILLVSIVCLAQVLVRDPAVKFQEIDNGLRKRPGHENSGEFGLSFREAVRTRQLWTVCLVYFIVLFCVYTIIMHIVLHAIDLGIPPSVAAGVLSMVGGVSITGRLLMGGAGDRIGEKKALMVCLVCLVLALVWLLFVDRFWMFTVFAVVYGFAHGGFFSLVSPLIAKFFGTRSHGLLFGIVIFSSTVGGALGPLMAGFVFDLSSSYRLVFFILGLLGAGALGLAATLKPLSRD